MITTMEQSTSPFKIPASPVTPLQQLSPDRINQQRIPQQRIPASPSLPNHLSNADLKLSPQSTDVQSKVAFLNSLNQAASPSRQQAGSTHAALQRALLGREEAENSLHTSQAQLAEAEVRQRNTSERLESLIEELQCVKERQVHERQVFEKEVRKARKDAFRASSALVKAQEDLKESRAETRNMKADLQHERFGKDKFKQEAFERAYTLAGVLEETEAIREKMRAMEAAREADLLEQHSIQLQRAEDDRSIAEKRRQEDDEHAERLLKAPSGQEVEEADQIMQPRQNRFERILPAESQQFKRGIEWSKGTQTDEPQWPSRELQQDSTAVVDEQLAVVMDELQWERKLRTRAEDLVHFLQMECQFNACACRVAEKNGTSFVYDKGYHRLTPIPSLERLEQLVGADIDDNLPDESNATPEEILQPEEDMFNMSRQTNSEQPPSKLHEPTNLPAKITMPLICDDQSSRASDLSPGFVPIDSPQVGLLELSSIKNASSPAIFSAEDMTYQSPIRTMIRPRSACTIPLRDSPTSPSARSPSASPYPLTPAYKTPQRPGLMLVRAQTTTMMVPLRDDDDVFCPAPGTPGTPVSRETALAQIRARRDRARSVAMSGSKSAPGSARRGLAGGLRDISAPGRF